MKRSWLAAILCLCLSLTVLAACKTQEKAPDPVVYPVTIGGIRLTKAPTSVICLSPSLTEILFDMRYQSAIVGVSEFCIYPEAATTLPQMGTAAEPNLEEIAGLKADLILTQEPLTVRTMTELEKKGIPVLVLNAATTLEELETLYQQLGMIFEGKDPGVAKGTTLYQKVITQITKAKVAIDAIGPVKALLLMDRSGYFATGDTFAGRFLSAMGLENSAQEGVDYTLSTAQLSALDPNLILTDGLDKAALASVTSIAKVAEKDDVQVLPIPLDAMTGQGLRIGTLAKDIAAFLLPESSELSSATVPSAAGGS